MIKRLTLLVVMLLVSMPAFAQTVDTAWVRRYNGPGTSNDEAKALAVDDSGNVYVTGRSYGGGTSYDYATIKYKSNGDTAWVRRYNGPGSDWDQASSIAVDDSGYVYVTGASSGSGTYHDYATIKYYPNGDTAWVRTYNGAGNFNDYASAIAIDSSGYVYVTGDCKGSGTDRDYATIKYYPNGDTAWVRIYNGPINVAGDWAYDLAVGDSGYVYVTGASYGISISKDFTTIKYRPDGDTAWVRRYDGPGNGEDIAYAIALDGLNNVYVTGYSDSTGTFQDYATIKYDSNGNELWVKRYSAPAEGTDIAYAIAVDGSNNVYVTGYSGGGPTDIDYATIKYYSNGDTAWVRRYNGPVNGWDGAFAIAIDGSNNVYVTGYSVGNGTSYDYATIKYYSNGDTAWVERYNGIGDSADYAYAIAVDDSGNAYVTGKSYESGTNYDYCTIKYSPKSTDVKDETKGQEKPSEFDLCQNYPNPFNPTTKIEFTLARSGFVSLNIYDILGRKVRTLVSEHLSSGYKSVLWDGKNDDGKEVASGVYFYQLRVGDFSEPKKMVLLK
jgi:hypothetical protein